MATILIVDDNPANRRLMSSLLQPLEHRLLEATDGTAALQMVQHDPPDLIVADVMMPVMDGHELLRHMREKPDTRRIPVVFVTAHYGARALALEGGAAWFLTNAETSQLAGVVERVLAGERQERRSSHHSFTGGGLGPGSGNPRFQGGIGR